MNRAAAERVAAAVLYEGYLLYPYRRSALKNRQRWPFGALYPRGWAEANAERSSMHTEVLVRGANARVEATVRWLEVRGAACPCCTSPPKTARGWLPGTGGCGTSIRRFPCSSQGTSTW